MNIPSKIFHFETHIYEVVSEVVMTGFFQNTTQYYIRSKSETRSSGGILSFSNSRLNSEYVYTFTYRGNDAFSPIYWDNPEEPVRIIQKAMLQKSEPYKKDENVVFTTKQ